VSVVEICHTSETIVRSVFIDGVLRVRASAAALGSKAEPETIKHHVTDVDDKLLLIRFAYIHVMDEQLLLQAASSCMQHVRTKAN
jgi:hypothetical protein